MRLQKELRAGRAVFFVGSGMSIDSEGNTTARLILRLLIRLRAFAILTRCSSYAALRVTMGEIRSDLSGSFSVKLGLAKPLTVASKKILPGQYYEFNDWTCSTFSLLLSSLAALSAADQQAFLAQLHSLEERQRLRFFPGESVPLCPVPPDLLPPPGSPTPWDDAGKALFLVTMGFRNPRIMGGDVTLKPYRALLDSYASRLRPRHWIWARFAREGWAPLIVTTNFDRLVEGAFRLSGFRHDGCDKCDHIPIPLNRWTTISEPAQFFRRGGEGRMASVVKIHGCAMRFDSLWSPGTPPFPYQRSMVFTYREIQNWRQDAWSRDFFRSLLRTRTVTFSGYSTKDPVIHDTLRSVYEEMRSYHPHAPEAEEQQSAPAYTISSGDGRDFYSWEVLRSASAAVNGSSPSRKKVHPNFLGYDYSGGGFPSPDHLLLWLNHVSYRRTQLDCLTFELQQLIHGLKIDPRQKVDLASRICTAFEKMLLSQEQKVVNAPDKDRKRLCEEITRWTYGFHPALLREFALADAAARETGQRLWSTEMRNLPDYYFPATARPAWTALGALLELVISRALGPDGLGWQDCTPAISSVPVLLFRKEDGRLPHCLHVRYADSENGGLPLSQRGNPATTAIWEIPSAAAPAGKRKNATPPAGTRDLRAPFHRIHFPFPGPQQLIDCFLDPARHPEKGQNLLHWLVTL
jgi:hypothetical protein